MKTNLKSYLMLAFVMLVGVGLFALESPSAYADRHPLRDNPHRIDNPPGPRGGRGTDWKNPDRRADARHRYQHADRKLERLKTFREKQAAKNAPKEKLEKIDRRIADLKTKVDRAEARREERRTKAKAENKEALPKAP